MKLNKKTRITGFLILYFHSHADQFCLHAFYAREDGE